MLPAQFVKPFVKSNKNDEIDAEAICEAASRPQMRTVAIRSEHQQDIQNLHRVRERLVKSRTALVNEIRGLLLEYGIVIAQGIAKVRRELPSIIEEYNGSAVWKETFLELHAELVSLDERIAHYDKRLCEFAKSNDVTKRLMKIPGVGELSATALYAAVGDAKEFKNGRQFAAWLGLTPRQFSTGGKIKLGRITKRGDKYLRKLLVLGARSQALAAARRRSKNAETTTDRWLFELEQRRGNNRATVALANKTARKIWKVLTGQEFKTPQELLDLAA
jgi:transposase